jgi:protease I
MPVRERAVSRLAHPNPQVRRTMSTLNPKTSKVNGKSVAILATHGFEPKELFEPMAALKESGAKVSVVSLPESDGEIKSFSNGEWGRAVTVDTTLSDVSPNEFDALVLPGGLMNPDRLRQFTEVVDFVRAFFESGKPVSAICHAPWLLVEADVVRGRTVTSYPSLKTDLKNAGATWKDESVITDHGLVTSRGPSDLEAFIETMLEEIGEGVHSGQHA